MTLSKGLVNKIGWRNPIMKMTERQNDEMPYGWIKKWQKDQMTKWILTEQKMTKWQNDLITKCRNEKNDSKIKRQNDGITKWLNNKMT